MKRWLCKVSNRILKWGFYPDGEKEEYLMQRQIGFILTGDSLRNLYWMDCLTGELIRPWQIFYLQRQMGMQDFNFWQKRGSRSKIESEVAACEWRLFKKGIM